MTLATSTGGTASTGGTTSPATGGMPPATGGTLAATGGSSATGGSNATGGAVATGGSTATGGNVATGGTVSTTGGAATGGSQTGGVSTGGVSSGGTTARPLRMLYTVGTAGQRYASHYVAEVTDHSTTLKLIGPRDSSVSGLVSSGMMLSPDHTRVVYSEFYDGYPGSDLYVSNVSGSEPTTPVRISLPVDKALLYVSQPVQWSPDGKHFLFAEGSDILNNHLYVVDLSGPVPGPPVQLDRFTDSTHLGMWYYFVGNQRVALVGERYIQQAYLVDFSGATPSPPVLANPPTTATGQVFPLCPSPDGRMLAYVGKFDGADAYQLWLVDTASGPPYNPVRVNPPAADIGHDVERLCKFSPDGSVLMFQGAMRTGAADEVIITTIKNGSPSALTYLGSSVDILKSISFVNSGKGMLYGTNTAPPETSYLYYSDLTGAAPYSSAQVATVAPNNLRSIQLSPDASLAVYGSANGFYMTQLDGVFVGPSGPQSTFRIAQTTITDSMIVDYAITQDNHYAIYCQSDVGFTSVNAVDIRQSQPTPVKLNPNNSFAGEKAYPTPDSRWVLYTGKTSTVPHEYLTNIANPTDVIDLSTAFPSSQSIGYFNGYLP